MIKVDPNYFETFYRDELGNLKFGYIGNDEYQARRKALFYANKGCLDVHICKGGEQIEAYS